MTTNNRAYLDLLNEMYLTHSKDILKISNVSPWPCMRIQTGYTMLLLSANKIQSDKIKNEFLFDPISFNISDVLKACRFFLITFKGYFKSKKILFNKALLFGFQEHCYCEKNRSVNLYISPFKSELEHAGILNYEFFISNNSSKISDAIVGTLYRNILKYHQVLFRINNIWTKNNEKAYKNALLVKNYLENKTIPNAEHIANIVYRSQIEQEIKYKAFKYFLKIVKPKLIWTYCYYDNTVMALIRAANDSNIHTIEYQHSVQSDEHNAYSRWQNPEAYSQFFPKTFWVWKQSDADRIVKNFSGKNYTPKVVVGGNLSVFQEKEKKTIKQDSSQKAVLVALQGIWIPDYVEKTIIDDTNFKWYFRLHPRYPEDKSRLEVLKNKYPDKIEIEDANRSSVYELFSKVNIAITDFSGVALEAEEFGVRNIIIGERGREIYKQEITDKIFNLALNEMDFKEILYNMPKRNNNFIKITEQGRKELNHNISQLFC